MNEPLFLKPIFQEKIWGGQKLKTVFDYQIPNKPIGECWAISAHPHGTCTVENGEYKGKKLDELWASHPELFDQMGKGVFPLLTKILDAADDLSVQVHPDDAYGLKHEGELGKTECWYIIEAEPGAEIIYGHHAKSKAELKEWIETGEWEQLLRRIKVKKGEFYFVPSGTIHAIGKGVMILETQQSSDTTYRVYDYDRTDDTGQKRALHIGQSIDVTTVPHVDPILNIQEERRGDSVVTCFIESDFFNVYEWCVNGKLALKKQAPYTLVSVLSGVGVLKLADGKQNYAIEKGAHFILPAGIKEWQIEGELQLIASEPGSKNR